MVVEDEVVEYLDEIRKEVCSRCIERPPGGPPCAPLGKVCGIEMHLPQLIHAIHDVHSDLIEPYLEHDRDAICANCAFLHSSICPCPMEYLLVLIVQAVERVDERMRRHEQAYQVLSEPPGTQKVGIDEVRRAYEEATGKWSGCDWHTQFGKTKLDLNGWTVAEAEAVAVETTDSQARADWEAAAGWLAGVAERAQRAELRAAEAVAAANAGAWQQAFQHAYQAWALEFGTGRPIRRGFPMTWQPLRQAVEAVLRTKNSKSEFRNPKQIPNPKCE